MDSVAKSNLYIENGQNHECCGLTDLVFKDIDYSQYKDPISFFRSDFSRSRFYSCTFNRNLFGRADFIDVYIKNTEFESVNFGSCLLKNALLEKVIFSRNSYRGIAIQYSCFRKCVFRDEDFITNMYHCDFYECTFINCTFKKSSLDSNTFSNCEFIKVDMSECIAENLKFGNCSLRDVFLGANLWTTYLYRDTDVYSFGFKYRGQVVDIWNGDPTSFIERLLQKKLFFEYFNVLIIGDLIPTHGFAGEFERLFPAIMTQSSQQRKSNIVKILDMLLYYQNYQKLPIGEYLAVYNFLIQMNWGDTPFDEVLVYNAKLFKIQKSMEQLNFDLSYIKSFPASAICISKYHINCDDAAIAREYLENAFNSANHLLCGDAYSQPLLKVIDEEKGSVILTIASAAILALLVSYVAKKVMHNLHSIQIEHGIKKQILKSLTGEGAEISDIKKSCTLAQKLDLLPTEKDSEHIDRLSSELTKGEILDIILNFLF